MQSNHYREQKRNQADEYRAWRLCNQIIIGNRNGTKQMNTELGDYAIRSLSGTETEPS